MCSLIVHEIVCGTSRRIYIDYDFIAAPTAEILSFVSARGNQGTRRGENGVREEEKVLLSTD